MITLTEKDADELAKYIRKEIESSTRAYNKACEENNKAKKLADSLHEYVNPTDEELIARKKELDESYEKCMKANKEQYDKDLHSLTHLLDLCTCGSEIEKEGA